MGLKMRLSLHVAIKFYGVLKVQQILVNYVHYVNVYITFNLTFLVSKTVKLKYKKPFFILCELRLGL
jgi:hypothetical protein